MAIAAINVLSEGDALNSRFKFLFMLVLGCSLLLSGCGGKSTAKSLRDSFNEGYAASGQKVENSPLYSKPDTSQGNKSKSAVKYSEKAEPPKTVTNKQTNNQNYNQVEQASYIGNAKTGVFHYSGCSSTNRIAANNIVYLTHGQAISRGYRPCGRCNP